MSKTKSAPEYPIKRSRKISPKIDQIKPEDFELREKILLFHNTAAAILSVVSCKPKEKGHDESLTLSGVGFGSSLPDTGLISNYRLVIPGIGTTITVSMYSAAGRSTIPPKT